MGWASGHISKLQNGETVQFRPSGHSMTGKVNHKQLCTVAPTSIGDVSVDDVVLCRVNGSEYLHLVKAKDGNGRVLIGNNRGRTNGWTKAVFGKLVRVEDRFTSAASQRDARPSGVRTPPPPAPRSFSVRQYSVKSRAT